MDKYPFCQQKTTLGFYSNDIEIADESYLCSFVPESGEF